jgi:hypothetical protein
MDFKKGVTWAGRAQSFLRLRCIRGLPKGSYYLPYSGLDIAKWLLILRLTAHQMNILRTQSHQIAGKILTVVDDHIVKYFSSRH